MSTAKPQRTKGKPACPPEHAAFADLLAACVATLSFARRQPWTGISDSKSYGGDLPKQLRAAIAKAKPS